MKTTITNQKNNFKKLTKVLGIGALICLGLKANAQQQCIASYTYVDDTVNTGNVMFTNTASIGNSPLTYLWDFGDGTTSNLENPNHTFSNFGTSAALVCLTVADSNGNTCMYCDSVYIGAYIGVACHANFYSEPDSISANGINFWNYSGGTPTSFFWNFGDNTTSTLENPHHIFADSGIYNVCLTIMDSSYNCQNTYCESVVVGNQNGNNGGCQAYFYSIPDSNSVNGLHFYNYSGGTQTIFSWNFGDSTSSTLENPYHIYANAGTYFVCLTISDSIGVTCNYCENVVIGNQNNGGCQANFYSYSDSTTTNSIYFSNYSGGNPTSFLWNFGDNTTSALANPNHIYANAGTYSVCLTVGDSSGITCTHCDSVVVGTQSVSCHANFALVTDSTDHTFIWVYDYSVCGNNGNCSYLWDFGDGTTSNSQYFSTHNYIGDGPFYLCLTVAGGNGCSNTHCDSIYLGRSSAGITLGIHNQLAGINESKNVNTLLENYPNPFSGSTTINYSVSKNAEVELSVADLLGNKIAVIENGSKPAGSHTTVWNVDNVAGGLYLLQLKVNNQITTKKIIINK